MVGHRAKSYTVQDFEDLPELLGHFEVRYLIIGGLAFIYHEAG